MQFFNRIRWVILFLHLSEELTVKIGILLEDDEAPEISQAFDIALAFARTKIPITENATFVRATINTKGSDASAIQSACYVISNGVIMVIGPMTSRYADLVGWIFEQANIPIISPTATNPYLFEHNYSFRMTGSNIVQGAAFAALYTSMGWRRGNIVTSSDVYGIRGLTAFIRVASLKKWNILRVARLTINSKDSEIIETLETLKQTGYRVTILNMFGNLAQRILTLAQNLNMTGPEWTYLVSDGVTNSESFDPTVLHHAGLIGTSYSVGIGAYFSNFKNQFKSTTGFSKIGPAVYQVADAVFAAIYSIQYVSQVTLGELYPAVPIKCNGGSGETIWANGKHYRAALLEIAQEGVNNFIQFKRITLEPQIVSFDFMNTQIPNGWEKIATYSTVKGYNLITPTSRYVFANGRSNTMDYESPLRRRHLRLVTIVEQPFVMIRNTPKNMSDLQLTEIEGYLVDLTQKLSEELGFTYTYYMVPDGNFGSKSETTGLWNGMARQLVDKEADMAAGSFTVTELRHTDFDFTTPYIDLGQLIVMNKVDKTVSTFRFVDPFSYRVWAVILISFVFVGLVVGFMEKASPCGTHGEFIQTKHNMEFANQSRRNRKGFQREKKIALDHLSMPNALWFSWASLLQQGYQILPHAMSGRAMTIAWWMTIVVFGSMYTAKLGSYMIVNRLTSEINSLADLMAQDVVQYGVTKNSAPYDMFCKSNIEAYLKVCNNINNWGTATKTTKEGFEKVQQSNGKFAFIWDSVVVESFAELQPCNLRVVGSIFGKIGLGIGLQKRSPLNEILSEKILALRAQGYMKELYKKWIIDRSECRAAGIEPQIPTSSDASYGVRHILGVFIIIGTSVCMSLMVLVIEWVVSSTTAIDSTSVGRPRTIGEGFAYRLSRMKNDILVNYIPDHLSSTENTRTMQLAQRHAVAANKDA